MKNFYYDKGTMFVEKIAMKSIAESYGTPSYIYSRAALTNNFLSYLEALEDRKSTRLNSSHSQQARMPSSA